MKKGKQTTIFDMPTDDERQKCEVYTRVVGYLSPVDRWNGGKKEEFKDRKTYSLLSKTI